MSTIDIRNLNLPQVGVQTDDTTVATSTPSTVVGTPIIQNPFALGYVAPSTSVNLPNGTSLNLPSLSQDDLQQVSSLFGGMSPAQLDNVNRASQRLAKALFAAVAANSAATTSSAVAVAGKAGASVTAGAGAGANQTSGISAAQAASQRVDSLTSSFYQTMGNTQMNVQPEDGDDDDDSDDDSDDSNSWGTTGSIPQMQNVQDTSSLAALKQALPLAQIAVSTSSVAAAGQNKTVVSAASATTQLPLNPLVASPSAVSTVSAAATGLKATSTATLVAGVGANRLADTATGANALSTIIQSAAGSTGTSGTQNKLLSSSSASQAPVVSVGTPEVYSAAANAVSAYQGTNSVTGAGTSSGSLDYDGSVNAVTYMGIIGLQNQLGQYAQQTQNQLNQLNQARTEYEDVTTAVSNWPAGQQTQSFTWTTYNNGQATTQTANLTYDQATALQSNLEDQVNGMSDTNQTQQLQLQSLTQDYQEAINTMSNLLKMDFDTVKAVISNIRS